MRVAYLCNVYPAVSHSFVRREIEGVEAAGHDVHRFTLRPPANNLRDEADLREAAHTEVVLGKGVIRLIAAALGLCVSRPRQSWSSIATARKLAAPGLKSKLRHVAYWLEAAWLVRRFGQLKIEHLHAHFGTNPAAVGAISRAWGGPTFSFTTHGPNEFDSPLQLSLPDKIASAKFVAGISEYGRSQLMRWSDPRHWDKIKIARCGLGPDFLELEPTPIRAQSREFVCVARLSPAKGLPLLIDACVHLRDQGERFILTIIGDGDLRTSLEKQVRENNLGDFVHLAGVRSSTEIREQLQTARAFVLPSFAEGLPVVIMEALALGRPVITTRITGIPELVDNSCGWMIAPGSVDELVDAMVTALRSSPDELNQRGRIGRDRVKLMHDAQKNAAGLVQAMIEG